MTLALNEARLRFMEAAEIARDNPNKDTEQERDKAFVQYHNLTVNLQCDECHIDTDISLD